MRDVLKRLQRVSQVIIEISRYVAIPFFLPWMRRESGPIRLRKMLEALGGTWIKLGQALALRFDLLPPAYCYELFKLLNEVKPFAYEQVREIIKEDFDEYPETLFDQFEPESFAAASIGQVHRAILHSGQKVAVKVQRPNIAEIIRSDISLMYVLAGILDRTRLLGRTHSSEVIDEFARWTEDELDYLVEARHAQNLRQNSDPDPLEKNAQVYFEYTSKHVLTLEFIDGIPLIDIMYAISSHNQTYLADIKMRGYDLDEIAGHIVWNSLNQIYRFGYFHSDLHPANLFVLQNNGIAYVDFGIVGRLSSHVRDSLMQYAHQLYDGNIDQAVEEILRWIAPSERTNIEAVRRDFSGIYEDYLFMLNNPRIYTAKYGTTVFEADLLNLIRHHQMILSPSISLYLKALITINAVVYELAPTFDLQWYENRFFGRMIIRDSRQWFDPRQASRVVFDYGYRLNRALESIGFVERSGETIENLLQTVRRRIQAFGGMALAVSVVLYLTLSRPLIAELEQFVPIQLDWLPLALLAILIILILFAIRESRKLPTIIRTEGQVLNRRWTQDRGRAKNPDS